MQKQGEADAAVTTVAGPTVNRFKLETVRRTLTVHDVQALTPRMLRVRLEGSELAGFHSPSPDDHVKIFFTTAEGAVDARDYTPRTYDAQAGLLTLDFALHEGGVGANWAQRAQPGMTLQIGGPRGSTVIAAPGAWWLLVGDETAIPSIARRLEELDADAKVLTVIAITAEDETPSLTSSAAWTARWVYRSTGQATAAEPFLEALRAITLPEGPGFVWIAAEGTVAQAIRSYMLEERKHPAEWVKAAAYWSAKKRDEDQ